MNQNDLLNIFKKNCKFDETMGLNLEILSPGEIVYTLKVDERHLSTPDTCHGGVLSGMMDATLGVTALSYAITKDNLCSTVEFKINFISPVQIGDELIGRGALEYQGNSLVVTTADLKNKASGNLVAKGLGTFNLYPSSKRKLG